MIRLHLLAIPHTITKDEFSHCAFTGKVQRFAPMMRSVGFEVYHYGVETSKSGADKDIELFTLEEWNKLRIESMLYLKSAETADEAKLILDNKSKFVGDLANTGTPLYQEFNKRAAIKLAENYRDNKTDIVCLPFGHAHNPALNEHFVYIETGIGYPGSFHTYRVFESQAWLHNQTTGPSNYFFVIPNYFNTAEFVFRPIPEQRKVGFLGRISHIKGCHIIAEIAKRFPGVDFILCGQGDATPYLSTNVLYKAPIHGSERSDFLGSCVATCCISTYFEPFGGATVESQLCGTPVVCSDVGGLTETVEQFKTGLRGHTLADYCKGIQMALDNKFDRQYIRDRAVRLYDMYNVAHQYKNVFHTVLDLYNANNGWYSPHSYLTQ